jgi:hypothetical protein
MPHCLVHKQAGYVGFSVLYAQKTLGLASISFSCCLSACYLPTINHPQVYLNGERLSIKSFSDYVDLYLGPSPKEGGPPRVYERVHERWEVCVSPTDGQFQQVRQLTA